MSFEILPWVVLALSPILLASFALFDLVIRRLYAVHRPSWKAEGSPRGFFFVPSEARWGPFARPGSSLAMQRAAFVWLFRTPEWARADATAKAWMTWFRLAVVGWNVGIISAFALAVLSDRVR